MIPLPSAVTEIVVYLRVTTLAETHQVLFRVSAAFADRDYVVHLFDRLYPAFREALFTQRVGRYISGTNTMPCPPILAGRIRCSLVLIVLLACFLPVLLAITALSEVRTARESTRSFGLSGH